VRLFDARSIVLAKHAQHVVLIHFPIALCLVGIGFDLVAQYKANRVLADVAYYNLLVAAFSTIPVLATGLLAWQLQLEGQRLKGTLLLHLVLAVVSSIMIWIVLSFHWRARRKPQLRLPAYRIPVELLTVAFITLTAHLGGILSGVNAPS
jgi:uncharacterized membrane protein